MRVSQAYLARPFPEHNYPMDFQEGMDPRYAHQYPIFNFITIESMLLDSRIQFALGLIKGPIQTYTKFFDSTEGDDPRIHQAIVDRDYFFSYKVEADSPDTEQFILRQLKRFWEVGVDKALTALEWGYSGSQVLYRSDSKNVLHFDNLHLYHARRVRPASINGQYIGLVHKSNMEAIYRFLPLPKSFWHVHSRQINQFTGRSRLKGAHIPWHENWTMGGARDIRRLWFFKNAYNGGVVRFPDGEVIKLAEGLEVPAVEMAERLISKMATGGYLLLPNSKQGQDQKDYKWVYEPPSGNVTPTGLHEYPEQLRKEILEGLGIPPEVVESSGSQGFGSATGRKVPYMGFIASLYPLVSNLLGDFRTQILDNLLMLRSRLQRREELPDYDITPIVPLAEQQNDQIGDVESDTGMDT